MAGQLPLADEDYARLLADIMGVAGSKVLIGDVITGLARLGLRLVPRDEADDTEARFGAAILDDECPDCGGVRWRLLNSGHKPATGPGAGWWHVRGDGWGFQRRCPE